MPLTRSSSSPFRQCHRDDGYDVRPGLRTIVLFAALGDIDVGTSAQARFACPLNLVGSILGGARSKARIERGELEPSNRPGIALKTGWEPLRNAEVDNRNRVVDDSLTNSLRTPQPLAGLYGFMSTGRAELDILIGTSHSCLKRLYLWPAGAPRQKPVRVCFWTMAPAAVTRKDRFSSHPARGQEVPCRPRPSSASLE